MKTQNKHKHINIVTLGCSKNLVDTEKISGQLKAGNIKVDYDSNDSKARTVVINTCGFIGDAKKESIDTILRYANAKDEGRIDNLYVMGCLSERYKNELPSELPEVDKMFGVNDIEKIVETLGVDYQKELVGERQLSTPSHYAYLKISEGCDRTCAFCAIPLIRGKHKSVPVEHLVLEAKRLVAKGVKEIILIAQDLTFYGIDIYKRQALAELLQQLSMIEGIAWIRLHYAYPASFPKDVLKVMRENPKICNYLDIPFQHISDRVLRMMKRGVNSSQTYDLIEAFRQEVPNLTLRTTLLVGHPGEKQEDFEELVEFVRKTRFDRLGVFTYSEEEDTYAAKYEDEVPEEVKKDRADTIMNIQEGISLEINQAKVGKVFKVLIDRKEGGYWIGRTEGDSPEVDNEILIASSQSLNIGEFYNVEITQSEAFDLYGDVRE